MIISNKIKRDIERIDNFYRNQVEYLKLNNSSKELLKANAQYKNMFKGQRCFIFGSGPSINTLDFSLFKGEVVFTVNELFRHQNFHLLSSNFHFIVDPAYLKLRRDIPNDLNIIKMIGELGKQNPKLEFFFPIEGAKAAHKYGWDRKINIHYFKYGLYFYDDYKEDIDYTKFVPSFQAVVQWCIAFAVYAGFKEIYLLGCDATNILTDVSLVCNKATELNYAYNLSEEEAKTVKKKHSDNGLEYTLYGYYKIVHLFAELKKYCEKRGVKLYNCSAETILECIPRKDINTVIRRGKDET